MFLFLELVNDCFYFAKTKISCSSSIVNVRVVLLFTALFTVPVTSAFFDDPSKLLEWVVG